jgi:integrase/recombinase XerD
MTRYRNEYANFNDNRKLSNQITTALGDYLRLKVADGNASELTTQNYYSQLNNFVVWCHSESINPIEVTEDDIISYRLYLVENSYQRQWFCFA